MSIHNAKIFIQQVHTDPDFRKLCNAVGSKEGIYQMLKEIDMHFEEEEFEEAINLLHVKCQTYEEADDVKQIEWWYSMF